MIWEVLKVVLNLSEDGGNINKSGYFSIRSEIASRRVVLTARRNMVAAYRKVADYRMNRRKNTN